MSALPFHRFTVDGFRGLRSLVVDDLRAINLIVGGNNSGKTSVLEAVALLCNPVNGDEWIEVVRRRDYGRLDESIITSLRWCFDQQDEQGAQASDKFDEPDATVAGCHFTMEGLYPLRSMSSFYKEFTEVLDPGESKHGTNAQSDDLSDLPIKTCSIESTLQWDGESLAIGNDKPLVLVDAPTSSRILNVSEATQFKPAYQAGRGVVLRPAHRVKYATLLPYSYQLGRLQVAGRSDQLFQKDNSLLLDLMRQFDPDILNVEVASFAGLRPAIYVKHKRLGVAPLSIFGDALRRCLLLATTMTSLGRGGVLLLDEVEVGIHTDALPKVFKWLADAALSLGVQVIATTHSLEVLDALLGAGLGDEALAAFQISQAEDRTECKRFSAEALKRLRYERGLDIR